MTSTGPGMALSIGRCTNVDLSPNVRSLLLYLERAGIVAYRRTLLPRRELACPLQYLPFAYSSLRVAQTFEA